VGKDLIPDVRGGLRVVAWPPRASSRSGLPAPPTWSAASRPGGTPVCPSNRAL